MENEAAYLKFQRLAQLRKLMTELRYQGPIAESHIYANRMRGRASGASALRPLMAVGAESGRMQLPEELGEFQPDFNAAIGEAHQRKVGTFQRKGLLDKSLINRRDVLNRGTNAQADLADTRRQWLPKVNQSQINRNNAQANASNAIASLRQRGYDDAQTKEAISAVMQYHLDKMDDMQARGVSPDQLPPQPSWDEIQEQAADYMERKRQIKGQPQASAFLKSRGFGTPDSGANFTLDGGDVESPRASTPPVVSAPGPGMGVQTNLRGESGMPGDDRFEQLMKSFLFNADEEGNEDIDDFDENFSGIGTLNPDDPNERGFDQQQMMDMLKMLRETGRIR